MPRIKKGDKFPDLKFRAYKAGLTSVSEIAGHAERTVIWAMRFVGCGSCQLDMDLLAEAYEDFRSKGAQVFVVLQSGTESIKEVKGEWNIPFDVILDEEHEFYRELDIRATATKEDRMPKTPEGKARLEAKQEQSKARGYRKKPEGEAQQLPALFIIGPDLAVEYAHYAENSVDIPPIADILDLLA